jgi:hypothetical protein
MSDPIQPTSLPPAPEPSAPALPNPQDMVDAALGTEATPKTEEAQNPEPAVTPSTPPLSPSPVAMGDDTPLAFAGIPTSSPVTPNETNLTATQPLTPPPTEGTPLPPIAPQAPEPKKKGKLGKIVVGVAALLFAIVGGLWGYMNMIKNYAMVAYVVPSNYCGTRGCPADTYCKNNQCVPNPQSNNNGEHDDPVPSCASGARRCNASYAETCSNGTWHRTNCPFGCANNTCKPDPSTVSSACMTSDNKPGFMHGGVCVATESCSSTDQNGQGCPIGCKAANASWTPVQEPGGGSYCDDQGRQCSRYRKELKDPNSSAHCFIGYGEQCGQPGSCGSNQTPPPSAPPTSTLACTGLTSVPAVSPAPTVGTKLTFTCAGTVTPTSAGTPSYKFRYSLNNATPVTMTPLTATPNKAELTINACGTYKVECQACATLSGVLTCSPVWTGATQ